jgi:AraC-like DNA-binding protein
MQYIIGIFIAFFLSVIILTKKGRSRADIILGVWMIVIGIHILGYYSFASGMIYIYPAMMWLNLPYVFMHGPMLYLYTAALTKPEQFKSKKWLWHFATPLLISFSIVPFMLLPEYDRIMFYKNDGKGYESYIYDWKILTIISGIIYVVLTYILLFKHKKRILTQFSNQEKINLNWLRLLLYGMGITWGIIILGGSDKWIFSTSAFLLVFFGFFGIKQVGIFTDQNIEIESKEKLIIEEPKTIEPNIEKKKYAKSSLNENTANEIDRKLQHLMTTERLFIEPELTLTDLATRLEIHPNHLSQVINLKGANFYDYINTLRIEEFKRLISLPENKKYSILGLAYECGFNSKSAFNRYFKKSTGLSPSEYLKNISSP